MRRDAAMMNRFLRPIAPAIAMAFAMPMADGQTSAAAEAMIAKAVTAAEGGQWEEALQWYDRCIEAHGTDAVAKFGPSFGVTWYRKGICEMRLKRWDAAAKSFEICYRDFPNKGKDDSNRFNKLALLRWGETAQAADNPAEAVRLFKKFLEERNRSTDKFEPGPYYIQLSLCYFKLGDLAQGAENLETAVRNKLSFGTPHMGIVAALQALVSTAIATKDEKTLLGFLAANRGGLIAEPFEIAGYSPAYVKLATDALAAGMDGAAITLFQLIPGSAEMADDLRAKITGMGELAELEEPGRKLVKADLAASLEALEKLRREGNPHETIQLGALALIHEKQGNLRGAYAAYTQLESQFPKSAQREDQLFNLARTGAAVGEALAVEKQGNRFLEDFPESRHAAAVKRLILVSLFEEHQYEACIRAATAMLPKLTEGSPEHDLCLRVLGGSYEETGRFAEAKPLIDRHVSLYPGSPYALESAYSRAANLARLQQWGDAAKLLDEFIGKYPDAAGNPYLALALLDRAECHVAANENAAALEKIDRLEKDFPASPTLAAALGLKGELLMKEGRHDQAEESCKKALELAESSGHRDAAAEALLRLVTMLGGKDSERLKDAVPYCDRFWKSYGDFAALRGRMALEQPYALAAVGRGAEALERLGAAITELAADPKAEGLESAVRTYAGLYGTAHGMEELKKHFGEFPGIRPEDKANRALFRIVAIEAVEEQLGSGDEAAKAKADALMKVLFQELKNDFAPKDLPAGILVRTGDFLRSKTSAPRQALPYYEEALSRKEAAGRFPALLGRAAVLAEGSKEERAAAIVDLQEVFAGSPDARVREDALYWLVMSRMKAGDFAAAGESAERYLAPDSGFKRLVPEVQLALARSYQERSMMDEALAAHSRVWSGSAELTRVSAPAMKAWMQISWARNAPVNVGGRTRSDRQSAYDEGLAYLERTRPLFDKMASIDQETWLEIEKLVADYAATTDVKPVAKVPEPAEGK